MGIVTIAVSAIGYFREAMLAARFGVSTTTDAYFGAIFIPNILYFILIAGTVSPVLIPILLQEEVGSDGSGRSETFSVVSTFSLAIFLVIICGCLPATHIWLSWLFPGFSSATLEMAVHLVYIIFPAVLFLAVSGILTAVLNGCHKFILASFAPALASIPIIAAVFIVRGDRAIYAVAFATAGGFLLQCLVLVPSTAALGIRYRPILNFRHPAIRKLLRLGIPLFLYLAVASASSVLERNIASRLSAGAVATLTYALRLFTVPASFLAAPLALVAYPGFAREAARLQRGELADQVSTVFRLVIFLFLPVTIWTITNSLSITRLLYEHGHFLAVDSVTTARVLSIYSLGILPNAIALVLLRCYYAIEDTVTPLLAESLNLASFCVTAPLFSHLFGIEGLVSGRAGGFFLVAGFLIYVLWRRKTLLTFDRGFWNFVYRTLAASIGMGGVSWLASRLTRTWFDSGGTAVRLIVMVFLLLISGAIFLGLAQTMKLRQARQIWTSIREMLPRW